jgi:hypothetical protein
VKPDSGEKILLQVWTSEQEGLQEAEGRPCWELGASHLLRVLETWCLLEWTSRRQILHPD